MNFQLDNRLKKDTFLVGELPLSKVLLMNIANFPWVVLVPKISEISELFELDYKQQTIFQTECSYISRHMSDIYGAHKMNVASLGNLVPQLHTHIIVRYEDDDAWPTPIWTFQDTRPYSDQESKLHIDKIRKLVDDYDEGENYE